MASIRLSEAMEKRLDALAAKTKRSKSYYVKEAIEYYLRDMEDAFIALERMRDPDPIYYTTHEVLKRLHAANLKKRKAK